MGSLRDCTWILGLSDYRVIGLERQNDGRLVVELERRGIRRYVCAVCGRRTGHVRDAKARTWDDLPWAEHPVTLRYTLRRLCCRHCGIRTERVAFADPHARLTRRLSQRLHRQLVHLARVRSGKRGRLALALVRVGELSIRNQRRLAQPCAQR